jgi:hypothetical protein
MKKFYAIHFIIVILVTAGLSNAVSAQDAYFREGFKPEESGWPSSVNDVYPSTTLTDYATITVASGVWYSRGVYRTAGPTGSCITQTGDPYHARWGNLNTPSGSNAADSAYLITPALNFGVGTLTFFNGRASRRISVYKTTDTDPATTNWTLAEFLPATNTACQAMSVVINDPAAKRLKIYSRSGTDSDLDSLVVTSTSPIVPVKFTGINAASVNGMTKVTWNIATEINTRSYIVEKSTDGANFKNAAEITATNAGTYSWIDQAANAGNVYYRVKAVDKDGKLGYSGVIKLATALTRPGFVITPNVIPGRTMNLQLTNIAKGTVTIRVSNNMGQIVYSSSLINEGGAVSKTISLPASLQAGTYRVQLVSGSSMLTQTAILQ